MAFSLLFLILMWSLFTLPGYILTGIGLHTIAARRGIDRPWLAWVPGVRFYLAGCISDQYQAMVIGKNKNKRTVLLVLVLVLLAAFCGMHLAAPAAGNTAEALPFLLIFLPAWGAGAALAVIFYMALYDIYRSCDPKNAVLFLVLSITVNVTQPFFLFFSRKKDLGFPL